MMPPILLTLDVAGRREHLQPAREYPPPGFPSEASRTRTVAPDITDVGRHREKTVYVRPAAPAFSPGGAYGASAAVSAATKSRGTHPTIPCRGPSWISS